MTELPSTELLFGVWNALHRTTALNYREQMWQPNTSLSISCYAWMARYFTLVGDEMPNSEQIHLDDYSMCTVLKFGSLHCLTRHCYGNVSSPEQSGALVCTRLGVRVEWISYPLSCRHKAALLIHPRPRNFAIRLPHVIESFCLLECPRFVISVLLLTCNITNFEMSKNGVRDL